MDELEVLEVRRVLAAEVVAESDLETLQSAPPASAAALSDVSAEKVTTGFTQPVFGTYAPGETNNLYVVQLGGQVRVLDLLTDTIRTEPFVTVTGIGAGGEGGLLGLAFAPDYPTSGFVYVYFTNTDRIIQIDRYQRDVANPLVLNPDSRTTILVGTQAQANHFGGWIAFGPDGFLYAAIGDGGDSNDVGPNHTPDIGNAQDITDNLYGKILRLDVSGADTYPDNPDRNYAIPASNPFVGIAGDDEIWAYGLRNPFRNSFDRLTGDLIIGDVGQAAREEINFIPANGTSGTGGLNFGWAAREGTIATPNSPLGGPKPAGAVDPIYEYPRGSGPSQGRSVTGGYVYRGPIADLQGRYFFGDFVNARIWSINIANAVDPATHNATNFTDFIDWTTTFNPPGEAVRQIASFGEDLSGNLYFFDLGKGDVYRVTGPTTTQPVFRTFNPNANFHFFTSSEAEYQAVLTYGYRDESSAPSFAVKANSDIGTTPIFRLYNPNLGTHYLTMDVGERDGLVRAGLNDEGVFGYGFASGSGEGRVEVYRLYNKDSGTHLFTTDPNERDGILAAFPGSWEQHTSLGFAFSIAATGTGDTLPAIAAVWAAPVVATDTAEPGAEFSQPELSDTRIGATPSAAPAVSDATTTSDSSTPVTPRGRRLPSDVEAPADTQALDSAFVELSTVSL